MAAIVKKSYRDGSRKKIRMARDRLQKREHGSVEILVLAKRLKRMVDEAVREDGMTDLLIAAHVLCDRLLK